MNSTPYQFQIEGADFIKATGGKALIAFEMGLGKGGLPTSKVLTPTGWTTLGEIQVGQEIIDPEGGTTHVVQVHRRGALPMFRVTFSDESSTVCSGDHLWLVNTPLRKARNKASLVMELKDITAKGLSYSNGNLQHYIPIVKPVDYPKAELPIAPYLMGYLLANGCMSQKNQLYVCIPDPETVIRLDRIIKKYFGDTTVTLKKRMHNRDMDYAITANGGEGNPIIHILKKLGLAGNRSEHKFIPTEYMHASLKQRLRLLQGLMDGDGTTSPYSTGASYSTSSKKLALGVQELIHSLGGTAPITSRIPSFTHKGKKKKGLRNYRIGVRLPSGINPFRLERKAKRIINRTKYHPTRAIKSVEPIGKHECICISVASKNKLYVTDDHIVTHNSITSLLHAFRNPSLRPIVIVTPASLKWNWERECSVHFGWRAEIVETTRPKEAPLPSKPKIVIVNYDILATRRGEGVGPGWLKALKKLNPQMLILDEVQYVSNPQTLRSKAVRELCEGVPVVIALSGTPLTNRPIELWPILNILAPDKFPSRYAFAHRYCAAKRTHWGWDFSGASNLDELNRKLQPIMIRRRKADVLKDLPAKRRSVVPMELSDPKEYEDARDDFSGWLAERDPNRMEKDDKANALVKIGHLKRLAARLKLPAAFEWLDSFLRDTDEKLVVFGIHRETIVEAIHERYANSAIVTGAVTGKKRQLAIDKFLRDKKCRLFVGNIDAAGVGWSAKGVSNVVFVELPWSPGKLSQCEDRCHGIGRGDENKNTHSWTLVGRGTIEEKLADVLQKKQRNLSKILDGKGNPDDLNIFDLLIKELGRKQR